MGLIVVVVVVVVMCVVGRGRSRINIIAGWRVIILLFILEIGRSSTRMCIWSSSVWSSI